MAGEPASDEAPRFWRYTANKMAEPWVRDRAYVLSVESALPDVEKTFDVAVSLELIDAKEAETVEGRIGISPGVRARQDRARAGDKDAEYQQLVAQIKAAPDDEAAETIRQQANQRADALIADAKVAG